MVTNGGYGAVQRALTTGVPLVVAGDTEDKPEVAARVEWFGAGVNLRTGAPTAEGGPARRARRLGDDRYRRGPASCRRPTPVATASRRSPRWSTRSSPSAARRCRHELRRSFCSPPLNPRTGSQEHVMKIRGPLVALGAVVAVGAGMWLVNVSQQNATPPAAEPAAAPTAVSAAPTPTTPPGAAVSREGGLRRHRIDQQRRDHARHHCRRRHGDRVCLRRQFGRGMASRIRGRWRGPAREQGPHQLDRRPAAWLDSHGHARDPRKDAGSSTPRRRGTRPDSTSTRRDAGRSSWIVDADGRSPVCSDAPTDRPHRRLR